MRCPEQANSETESRIEGSQGWWEGRNRELLLNEYRVTVWDDEQVLEIVVNIVNVLNTIELYFLNG